MNPFIISYIHLHALLLFSSYTWTWSFTWGFTGDSAWSPELSSYNQHLTMELGDRYEIRSIATRGRAHTNEYVTEYIIQYSDDGQAWASYESQDGVDEVLNFKDRIYNFSTLTYIQGDSLLHTFKNTHIHIHIYTNI